MAKSQKITTRKNINSLNTKTTRRTPKTTKLSAIANINLANVYPTLGRIASVGEESEQTAVVFTYITGAGKVEVVQFSNAALGEEASTLVDAKIICGKAQETYFMRLPSHHKPQNILFVGVGPLAKVDQEVLRIAGSSVYACLKANKSFAASVRFGPLAAANGVAYLLQAFWEGFQLSAYDFNELKSKKSSAIKGESDTPIVIAFSSEDAQTSDLETALSEAQILAESVNFARRLGDLPGNLLTPSKLADLAVQSAKGLGIRTEIWNTSRIKKERMGGLLGVANGSAEEPRFIIMEYKGGKASEAPVVFVGKGLTFDSGGISIKPSAAMEEMKYDMCGGACAIGTILAIAKLGLAVNAVALVPATENMPGGSATKPGDVHTARNGKTFEINNTDAEGRLILADALCYATELQPKAIFDVATLTGAIVVALGNTHTGYFTRSQDLVEKIQASAEKSGELVWNMPLTDFHVKDMKGTYADLSNISSSKGAGSATAAAFLEQFVGESVSWAHFDIAGTGWGVGGRFPYHPKKGASGIMIRTFVELARTFEP